MKTTYNRLFERILVIVPVFALLFVTCFSMTGCTKKKEESSDQNITSTENTADTIIEDEGELEISVPEDEETFGE